MLLLAHADPAGEVMLKAMQAQFGAAVQRCYKSMSQAVDGDRYLSTFISGPSERSVCLNITQLLQDAAQGLQGQQHEAAGLAAPVAQHSSAAGSSSSSTGCMTLQDGPTAAASASAGAGTTAAGFERTSSSPSSAAESAAAALRAAAESLMPPAASSTANSKTHTLLQANTPTTHSVAQPQSSSTAAAAAAAAGSALQALTAAVQEAAVSRSAGTASPCRVRQPPGFPPWLNPLQTAGHVSDSQLRSPSNAQLEHPDDPMKVWDQMMNLEAGSSSSIDGSSSSQASPARQDTAQQQPVQQSQPELSHSPQQASAAEAAAGRARSGAAAAAVSGSCEGQADRSRMDVPLQYQLLLQNSATPGWYTAEYVVTDAADLPDKPHQASAAAGGEQDSGQCGVVGGGAAGPAAVATPSILQILPGR